MIEVTRPLVVGIGSPHGDDQAGWMLIERLSALVSREATLRTASVPHNLIDWTDGCDALHLVDACEFGACEFAACDVGETVRRIELTDESSLGKIASLTRCQSSHQFGIGKAIELGQVLGKVPRRIVIWAIPGENFGPCQRVSDLCREQVDHCALLIAAELAR